MGFSPSGDSAHHPPHPHFSKIFPFYKSGWGGDVFIQSCYIFMVVSMSFVKGASGILLVKFGNNASDYIKIKINVLFTPSPLQPPSLFLPSFQRSTGNGFPYLTKIRC